MSEFPEIQKFRERLDYFANNESPPSVEEISPITQSVQLLLQQENPLIRPLDGDDISGGLIELHRDLPTILVPDLHARRYFLMHLLDMDWNGLSLLEQLERDEVQVLCVGDGFHSERRGASRWKEAFKEYKSNFRRSPAMDEEMSESLGVMAMVMLLKNRFPDHFHFLKGNHENIRNEYSAANRPFGKFAYEGDMVKRWTQLRMGDDFLELYASFEDQLPILARGSSFLVSHAEPAFFYSSEEVINYRSQPSMIFDFSWTANDDAQEDAVKEMLEDYLPNIPLDLKYYFGGHRPVNGLFNLRAEGKYVQFHNPQKEVIIILKPDEPILVQRVVQSIS